MTAEAKKALSKTIRALRARLLEDLHGATESAYLLSAKANQAKLDEASRVKRERLEGWIEEQVRSLPKAKHKEERERLRREVEKDAAFTLLLRLTTLRLLEATGLRREKVVTGGWESSAYKDFRQLAPELALGDPTEGYATLLQYIFDDLSVELPGLFGEVRLTGLVPIPPATLRVVIEALNAPELESCWKDDTTLGWVYQYWNDPEREALDKKLNEQKKLDNHEIASKTQMFTERYMVEWLLHNSLGTQWLAICKKNGWIADVSAPTGEIPSSPLPSTDPPLPSGEARGEGPNAPHPPLPQAGEGRGEGPNASHPPLPQAGEGWGEGLNILQRLDLRRAAWRKKREAGQVPLDALMPIEPGLEERWKYWVPQPITQDMIDKAPTSLRDYKLLDPACGSGHFLVIALGLLYELYLEEARHRGEAAQPVWQPKAIVEHILAHNLYGIDIDPRAVQIAAAALWLKAKQLCPDAEPTALNLVAPNLSLASLSDDDPALTELITSVERETGIPASLTLKVVHALKGADHLGTLLKVDAEIEAALDVFEREAGSFPPSAPGTQGAAKAGPFGRRKPQQGDLLSEQPFGPEQLLLVTRAEAKATLLKRLERFLSQHGGADDLGLRLRGEQLAAGVRFVRLVREGQYDLVVGNPPYQGTGKMADAKYVQKHYPRGKADLYAAFLERGLQLAKEGGVSALLTMRNWMFIKQYAELREWLLQTSDLRLLGDVGWGAFREMKDNPVTMSVFANSKNDLPAVALAPVDPMGRVRTLEHFWSLAAGLLCQVGRFEFEVERLKVVPEWPVVYWWSGEFVAQYASHPKLGTAAPAKQGIATANNNRFLRASWEVACSRLPEHRSWGTYDPLRTWQFFVKGGEGACWFEPCRWVVLWYLGALEMKTYEKEGRPAAAIRNEHLFFRPGIAFSMLGAEFSARLHRRPSVFDTMGSSVFPAHLESTLCALNSRRARGIMSALNPTVHFQQGDVDRLPLWSEALAEEIVGTIHVAFSIREAHREPSVEFTHPGPSPWRYAQAWAQRAVDRPEGEPLPLYEPEYDPEPPIDHLSFAVGVALGRFGANREGILDPATADLSHALPHGMLYLSVLDEGKDKPNDSLGHPAAEPIVDAWETHGAAIQQGEKTPKTLREYLSQKFFSDVHRPMYENRPIHFPLSSEKKNFVAWVNIHRWHDGTLRALLAEHLYPDKQRLEGELADLREARQSADKKQARDAERRFTQVSAWLDELNAFIAQVEQCAEKGPPPTDPKCPARETDRRFHMDLDDGVMINSAALWPLLDPQWKDPKKWWKQLALAEGKKDYDWAHLSARYFPRRVYEKCKKDPSLAVAHSSFWKLHPENAYKWELRLQDEIGPDFKLDEPARVLPGDLPKHPGAHEAFTPEWVQEHSDHYRAQFEAEHPDKVEALVAAEHKRREKKRKKQGDEDEAQGELELEEAQADEELAEAEV